jgi:P4 family phage/plasmid primase-like protien
MNFTLYTSNSIGKLSNCIYPNKVSVSDEKSLADAVKFDHVTASYKDFYRSNTNFIESDNIPLDCDNDHSDDEREWVTPIEVAMAFPDVGFAVVYSRNNMQPKGSKSARPRFHIYFPIPAVKDSNVYAQLKQKIAAAFPYFDNNALDSARLLFGVENPQVEIYKGNKSIMDFVDFETWDNEQDIVPEGQRNTTMSRFAGRILKRYGVSDRAYEIFLEKADKCNPPLEDDELKLIWHSACKFAKKVQSQDGYLSPEEYELNRASLKPSDYSDIGQAKVIAREYGDELIYTAATDLLRYNGVYWEESKQKAVGAAIEFLDLQLEDAVDEMQKAFDALVASGVSETDIVSKKVEKNLSDSQAELYNNYCIAKAYKAFVMKRRDMKYITSALQTLKPLVNVAVSELDSNPYYLNTPSNTYDLRKGMDGIMEHNPADKITKVTAFDPSDKGKELWIDALNNFFSGDTELIDYVQQMSALSTLGKVFIEAMMIAYGDGGNGKSTFGNAVLRTIGSYGGTISADALTVGCKRNVKPELAETKGKRLLIAAELEEGMRLNTSMVKQLCSTDEIAAEKKYKDPFHFTPSHTVLLYTNHLPRVGAMDEGIWRRLIVIPFNAKISVKKDVKNYADYLVENAGEYILKWLIEGAEKIIKNDFKLKLPKAVEDAINIYKRDNDWLAHFFEDCCELGEDLEEKSGGFYDAYRAFCNRTGEYVRNSAEFYAAIEQRGIKRKKTKEGRFVVGIKLINADFVK